MRKLGLRTLHVRKSDDSMVRLADGSWRTMAEARRLYPDFDLTRSWNLPDLPVQPGDEDFESYLKRAGFSAAQLQYVRRAYGNAVCEDIGVVSALSCLAEIRDTSAGSGDYRILDGYDHLGNDLAQGLDIRLDTVVDSISWNGGGVRVGTVDGAVYEADRAVITLPLGVLQAGRVRFSPGLPAQKWSAINTLKMGLGIKMVYRFAEPAAPPHIMAIYSAGLPPMWWSPSFGQPDSACQLWTAFATGNWARSLLALGESGALEQGLKTLRHELGRPDLRPTAMHLVNWPADPFALGGYSVTPPGGIGARTALAQPIDGRLFWAGEATAPLPWIATVHGAYASGRRAAQEVLAAADGRKERVSEANEE